jgi:Flp pilus assembly pilin Flp
MEKKINRKSGQTMVEYIIIVVIIAIAAIAVFGIFSDTIRQKLGGATEELGGDASSATQEASADYLKNLGDTGNNTGN